MPEDQKLQFDKELVEFVCQKRLKMLTPLIITISIALLVMIGLSVITGFADYADNQTTAGFFGSWVGISALVVVASGSYIGYLYMAKNGTQFKQYSPFEILTVYKSVIEEHSKDPDFEKYIKLHPSEKECIAKALLHNKVYKKAL